MNMIDFFRQMLENPMLFVSTMLTLGVILVNGWTDAPNAIATCVSTRAIGVRKAIIMAAIFNFLGVLVMTIIYLSIKKWSFIDHFLLLYRKNRLLS